MFSRYIDNIDFKSRFRILKGGKISLIISAMLMGTVTAVNATPSTPISVMGNTLYYNENMEDGSSFIIDNLTVADSSAFEINGYNKHILSINGSNISAMGEAYSMNGIIIYNLASYDKITDTQKITINLDKLYVENRSGEAFGFTNYPEISEYNSDLSMIMNINNSSQDDYGIKVSGVYNVAGISLYNLLIDSEITNNGNIIVSNVNDNDTSAYGINMSLRSNVVNRMPNNTSMTNLDHSTITNNGTFEISSNSEAYGIYLEGIITDSVINNTSTGSINITTTATTASTSVLAYGIEIEDNFKNSSIYNTGEIKVLADANSYDYVYAIAKAIHVNRDTDESNNSEIINYGTITANVKITPRDYDNYEYMASGIDGRISRIENQGTIEAYINDELDKNAYSLNIIGTVINNGTLKGNINVDGSLENSGTIELAHNAMADYNAYIKNFTNEANGKLTIGLKTDGTLNGTTYSQLTTENAIFENGSTLDVDVLKSSTNQLLLAGKRLENVVTASTELTINGKLNITDNSTLLNFEYKTSDDWINGEDGVIHLDVVKASNEDGTDKTILSSTIAGKGNQNSQNAAVVLQNVYNNNQAIQSTFNKLSTDSAVANAVESTTPVSTNATVGATTQISNGIAGIVTQRQNANISAGGINSGDGMFSENNLWIKPFVSIGSQNDKDGINGFDLKTYGLGFGADTEYKDNQKVGVAFFYTNGNVDVNNMNQNADLDVFTTLIYGNVPVIDDKTNFLYQAGYAWQNTQTDRGVFTGDTAESKYTSKTASLDLKLMRDVNVSKDLLLQPLVNTTYRHFTNPSYNETGAGALNLNVDKFTSSDLIVGLGTLAHYKLTEDSKIVGNVNVGYDLHDKAQTITSAYEGANGVKFGTDGIDNGRWSYEAGIGYEMNINKTNNINVSYDYQGQGKDFSNNVVSAKYVLKF